MARKHYWQFLVTDEGNPIENAQISVYTAGTEDPVYIYTDEIGGDFTDTAPQVTTGIKGYFEFWIADQNEPNGYPLSTKFKIAWQAIGVSSGYIDYIDVFSTAWAPVDETDTDTTKNKAVSNYLAKGWEDHIHEMLPGKTPHGLDFVDETDNDVLHNAGKRNKVISNYLGYVWDNHARTLYNGDFALIASGDPSPAAHGIEQVDETITGTVKNKLVSNSLAKSWTDHLSDMTDPHPQYMPIAGNTGSYPNNFTGIVGGVSTLFSDPDDTLVTKDYVDSFEQVAVFELSSNPNSRPPEGVWIGGTFYIALTDNGDGTYSAEFPHGTSANYPFVTVWYDDRVVQPEEILRIDPDTLSMAVTQDGYYVVRVAGRKA